MEEKIGRILIQVEARPFRIPNICFDFNRKTLLIAVFMIVFLSLPIFLSRSTSFVPFIILVHNNHSYSFMCRQRVHSEL